MKVLITCLFMLTVFMPEVFAGTEKTGKTTKVRYGITRIVETVRDYNSGTKTKTVHSKRPDRQGTPIKTTTRPLGVKDDPNENDTRDDPGSEF